MDEDVKKISFSFKQVSSKPKVTPVVLKPDLEKTVQFIDCVEEKSIKVFGVVENNDHELVIPMQPSVKRRLHPDLIKPLQNGTKSQDNGMSTLDKIAVQAILSDCKKTAEGIEEEEDTKIIEVPMLVNPPEAKEISTAEDYENVPVNKFGLAMIRGMGWEPTKGIGKNSQVIAASLPDVRPKGMGLGADKLIKSVKKKQNLEEELKLKDGSYVQFVLGRLDGQYGQVKGFDEGDSRVVVKMSRTGLMEKVNENTFRLVTKSDYDKNSKVINIKEFKDYHEGKTKSVDSEDYKINEREDRTDRHESKSKRDVHHHTRHHKTKKSKHSKSPHRKHKSDYNRHKKYKHKKSSS